MVDNDSEAKDQTVYIFNMSEDVWPFINTISTRKLRDLEIVWNSYLCERDLFSFCLEDNVVFVFPNQVSKRFLDYYSDVIGYKNFTILSPKYHSGETCLDAKKDLQVLRGLVECANGRKRLIVQSYATTPQFYELIETLRLHDIDVTTPQAPKVEDGWTVNFFGSKSGIRQLSQQTRALEPDFRMSDGVIVMGILDASKIAATKYCKNKGIVLKTNKGHSGVGIKIFRDGDLPDTYIECQSTILGILESETYWRQFPIVVEDLIPINSAVGNGFPSIEFYVGKNGHVEHLYFCTLRVTKNGEFRGIEIHSSLLSEQVTARIIDTGFFIGEQLARFGYRGFFDIDYAASKDGELYVTETNVRRTGGTHVYFTATKLFGKNFMNTVYTLSNDGYELPDSKEYTFSTLYEILQPVLFSKKTKEGVVLVSEQILKLNRLAYIIFGSTKKRAYEIESRMEYLLRTA